MSIPSINFGSQQMKVFLRDFLEDIRSLIFQIKAHVFKITDLQTDYHSLQNPKVYPNFHSILKNCTQTHEDLKRINYMLKGYTVDKQSQIQPNYPPINFSKNTPNRCQRYQNNITFQRLPENQIICSCKTDDQFYEALTINSQNDFNKLNVLNSNPKIHWRNKTKTQFYKGASDKQPIDSKSYTEALTKRTNFTTLRKKTPDICLRGTIDSVNEISDFSAQNGFKSNTQKENKSSKNTQQQNQRNENLSFTFLKTPVLEESKQKSTRCSKILEQNARRDSKCIEIIRSLRRELSR